MTIFRPTLLTPLLSLASALLLTACHSGQGHGQPGVPGEDQGTQPFTAIAPDDTLHFVGTEPFWGGEASGGMLTYSTPGNPDGTRIPVKRFGGRNGLGLSGMLDGDTFDMTVTPGTCSDGMSDRRYPFTVTLNIGGDIREGCGWTDSRPATEPQAL
ncbi:COG3650 family protein [Novosphingobium sp. M1R2S20]|uniref:COG3650 family protein n=1 Tax=Novosphingobium rhizovicinum TaxID=3228928 RepID=A0ABV3RG10_9SPHN